jgi:hypothetical protein
MAHAIRIVILQIIINIIKGVGGIFWDAGLLIALMMEAANISETRVNFYQTTQKTATLTLAAVKT